jgi:hypothetical protein
LIGFFAWNAWRFGDFLAFIHAERAWGRTHGVFDPADFARGFLWAVGNIPRGLPEALSFAHFLLALFVLATFAAARLPTRLSRPYVVYMASALAVCVWSPVGAFTGGARHLMVLFPAYAALAAWWDRHPLGGRLLLLFFAVDGAVLAPFFVRSYPVF